MMHDARRRRIAGGLAAALATAGLLGVATFAAPGTAELPGWTHTVLAVALAAAAVAVALVATVWAVRTLQPHVRAAVRALRARHIRRRARTRSQAQDSPQRAATRRQRAAAALIVAVVVAAVATVTTVAVALNYAHGMDVASYNGEHGWRAWLYPLSADGLMVSASLVLVWQYLAAHGTSRWARVFFALGIAASLGTNVLAALHSGLTGWELSERIVWTSWPTVALFCAHEMLLRILRHYAEVADVFGRRGEHPAVVTAREQQQAAEQRAAAAEAEAEQARQRSEADQAAAHEHAQQRIREVEQQAEQQLAELRQQYDSAQEEHRATEADLREKILRLQSQVERQYEDLARAQAELAEIEQTEDDERSAEDYRALQRIINDEVADLRRSGEHGSLTTVMARRHHVSARWVQQHTDAPARRNREEELQLAAAG